MTVSDFFIWCSGADRAILGSLKNGVDKDGNTIDCQKTEREKYVGVGGTIFFTALMAILSGGYAFHFTFDNLFATVLFALLWGALIFNLDRYIIISMKKTDNFKEEVKYAIPRFIMAIILAVTISKPLELRLFNGRVQKQIGENQRSYVSDCEKTFQAKLDSINSKIKKIEDDAEVQKEEIFSKDNLYAEAKAAISSFETRKGELDQTISEKQGIIEKNTSYKYICTLWQQGVCIRKSKQTIYNATALTAINEKKQANNELREVNTKLSEQNDKLDKRTDELKDQVKVIGEQTTAKKKPLLDELKRLDSSRAVEIANCQRDASGSTDILARMEALGQLSKFGNSVWWASLMITLLFVVIEVAPIAVKLISKSGPYDDELRKREYAHKIRANEAISKINTEINDSLILIRQNSKTIEEQAKLQGKLQIEADKNLVDAQLKANQDLLNLIAQKQADLAKAYVDKWYKEQEDKLNNPNSSNNQTAI